MPPNDPLRSPDRFLYAFEGADALILPVTRAVYRRSIFLDQRIALDHGQITPVPVAALGGLAAPPRTGWIFHIAHCGSTLLARALDRNDATLVLREPLALRQLGVEAARGARGPDWATRLAAARALLGRRYAADAPAIVKANVPVNAMLDELLAADPDAPAILLHFPLEPYLLAILRSDGHRGWVEHVTGELAPAIAAAVGPIAGLGVAEKAAALWLFQMRAFAAVLARFPNARALDAAQLFAAPAAVLRAAFALFGVGVGEAAIAEIVAGPLFSTYSKNPALAFDNAMRAERQAALAQALRPELDRARAWLDRRPEAAALPARLTPALTGEAPRLLS
jgi:hypothetical protein